MAAESIAEKKQAHVLARPGVYNFGIWSAGYIPKPVTYAIAGLIADLSFIFYKKAGENLKDNLARVFPEAPQARLTALSRKTFRNYSKYLVDYCRFKSIDKKRLFKELVRIDGGSHIDDCLADGKGIILLTAHLGNWELGGIFFGKNDIRINVLTARDSVIEINEIKERYRKMHNINTIVLGDDHFAGLEALNALMRNEVVAMLVDREGGTDGVTVPFFGRPLKFPMGPLLLARAAGSPIMPAFVVREEGGYRAIAEKPIYFDKDKGDTPESVALRVIKVFEDYIRKYPDQWYNFVPVS